MTIDNMIKIFSRFVYEVFPSAVRNAYCELHTCLYSIFAEKIDQYSDNGGSVEIRFWLGFKQIFIQNSTFWRI